MDELNYELPKEMIAQFAYSPRDECKLMVVNSGIEHKKFFGILNYLKKGDVLVVNKTKVKPAKLVGKKMTGAKIELILTKNLGEKFECRVKGRVKVGTKILFGESQAEIVGQNDDIFYVKFFNPIEDKLILPTPPYIERIVPDNDYQTIFAQQEGSLAAPTAGLHFSDELVEKIKKKGVTFAYITLHIGFGTFLKVKGEKTEPEYFEVTSKAAEIINNAKRLICVGTTSVKTVESAVQNGKIVAKSGYSDILIKPGYKFKNDIFALITNFHLPKSSLLMLVCAFSGKKKILDSYKSAIDNNYRFYSLGDAMLLFR